MKDDVRVVSIDSSTRKTGVALFINGKLQESKLIDLSASKVEIDERIDIMGANLIIMLTRMNPDIVYIEIPKGQGKNVQVVLMLSEILGIVRGWCIENSRHYEQIQPTEWRSYLGLKQGGSIKREELKRESVKYVRDKYDILVNDDVADSICIGDAMIKKYSEENNE